MTISKLTHEQYENNLCNIYRLLVEVFNQNEKVIANNAKQLAEEKTKEMGEYLKDGTAQVIAAFDDTTIIGFAWFYKYSFFSEERFHLTEIIVDEKYRGKGIGHKMIKLGLNEAKESGVCAVDLFANARNVEVRDLYESMGFKQNRIQYLMTLENEKQC